MTKTKMEPCVDEKEYLLEKVTIDNIPDIGDKTGETFLKNLEEAIANCRKLIDKGFRLTDFWTDPDVGVEFVLKKKKAPGDSCELVTKE